MGWNANIVYPKDYSSATVRRLVAAADSEVLFLADPRVTVTPGPRMFERMAQVLRDTGAGWVYSDAVGHPRIDYRPGSLRDTFDFGPVVAVSVPAAHEAGVEPDLEMGRPLRPPAPPLGAPALVRIPEPL